MSFSFPLKVCRYFFNNLCLLPFSVVELIINPSIFKILEKFVKIHFPITTVLIFFLLAELPGRMF